MLTSILSFIIVLGFLVLVHELGHFLAARHVGVRVERFAIFFPLPVTFKFLPTSIYKKTIGETEYVVNWLPLGGYVKLFGQNLDDEDPSDPANYAAKTKLQRAYILAAGPLMNLIWAVLLISVFYMIGVERPDFQTQISAVQKDSLAAQAGFQAGDRIVKLGDTEISKWSTLRDALQVEAVRGDQLVYTVQRQGAFYPLRISTNELVAGKPLGLRYGIAPTVGGFRPDSPARAAGMALGDRVLAVNGKAIQFWSEMSPAIQAADGKPVAITVNRGGNQLVLSVQPIFEAAIKRWLIQIQPGQVVERFGMFESVSLGVSELITISKSTFMFLGRMVMGEGSLDALAGPVRMAPMIGQTAEYSLVQTIKLMAIISLSLGLLNLFPIPALDGGHMLLLGFEAIKRGPLSQRLRERTQMVGVSLLLALFITITYNDLRLLFFAG